MGKGWGMGERRLEARQVSPGSCVHLEEGESLWRASDWYRSDQVRKADVPSAGTRDLLQTTGVTFRAGSWEVIWEMVIAHHLHDCVWALLEDKEGLPRMPCCFVRSAARSPQRYQHAAAVCAAQCPLKLPPGGRAVSPAAGQHQARRGGDIFPVIATPQGQVSSSEFSR